VRDDNPGSAINDPQLMQNGRSAAQNRLIAYNRQAGQYMSLMEAVVPEQFWTDKTQCRYQENGQLQNPTLPDCVQGISAVKAIVIVQQQGQKVYTITQQNASTALSKLPIGGSVGQEIKNAVLSGKEVTVHEKPIDAYGWSGYGYIVTDPETGNGAYLIEGNGNGSYLLGVAAGFMIVTFLAALIITGPVLLLPAMFVGFTIAFQVLAFAQLLIYGSVDWKCFAAGFLAALTPLAIPFTAVGLTLKGVVGMLLTAIPYGEAIVDFTGSRESCMR
jgi:hypothetical protein